MIIVFSGNGNSKYVADLLSKELLDDNILTLEGNILTRPSDNTLVANENENIIWCFPCYSWGVPPVVVNFINNINLQVNNNRHYLVVTCGDDIGLTANQWRHLIGKRNWIAGCACSVIMPNTYVCMKGFDVDSKEIAQAKLDLAPKRISHIAFKIKCNSITDDVTTGSWKWIKSNIIYPYFKRWCMSSKPFHTNISCTKCGKCVNMCPMKNIALDSKKKPSWGNNCALCLRCYHICPAHAIEYGSSTKDKGQYQCKK